MTWKLFLAGFLLWLLPLRAGLAQQVNFGEHIAPIIFRHCTPCHQPGEAGPMSFTNYREVVAYGAMIAYVTRSRYMPPFRAAAGYGHFSDDLRLSAAQIEQIQTWAGNGFQAGPALLPETWKNYSSREDRLSDWDIELRMDTAFEQYDIYFDQYQVFRLTTGLTENRWVDAIEFVPGDRSIVRYVNVALNTNPVSRQLDAWDPRYGYTSFGGFGFVPDTQGWFTWSVGAPAVNNSGALRYLPAGAELLVYVHYGPTGEKKFDQSALRLRFADPGKQQSIMRNVALVNPMTLGDSSFLLAAGQEQILHASVPLPAPITIHSIAPQALLLATSWEVFASLPDGRIQRLLKVADYDIHWRREYWLRRPVTLPSGTTLHARARYDNRAQNPAIPSEYPAAAKWGYRIFDEQFLVKFQLSLPADRPEYCILPVAGNQVGTERTIFFVIPPGEKVKFSLRHFSEDEAQIFPPDYVEADESGNVTISFFGRKPGNYLLEMVDATGSTLASDLMVYWPVELTKTILDD